MKVTLEEFGVVQSDDYYPFGLTFNHYQNLTGKENKYLYQGKELLVGTSWYDFHARGYNAALGRFMQVDPAGQFVSGFTGMGNNPITGIDPDGKFLLSLISKIVAGDIDNAGDVFSTVLTGSITDGFNAISTVSPINIFSRDIGVATGLWNGVFNEDWERFGNAGEILLGQFYTDNNRSFSGEIWQGISRNTMEHLQTTVGYNYSQWRNTVGNADRVDLFAGATFVTRENQDGRHGVSLGNFINVSIEDEITGSFEKNVINDPLFMHEYGHTFTSQSLGPFYLPIVGLPSVISASGASHATGEPQGVSTHDFRWYEMSANRHAARYFGRRYGIDWDTESWRGWTYETFFPRRRR